MTLPGTDELFRALETTWPSASKREVAGFTLRDGKGGGQRVSAATPLTEVFDIDAAEAAMRASEQRPLFRIGQAHPALDGELEARGYARQDPTLIFSAPAHRVQGEIPPVTAFAIWPPLAVMREIWAEGGIGASRVAVMERCDTTKTAFFGRTGNRPAGTAFAALHESVAMVHALEIRPDLRRCGLARQMMQFAANWAVQHDASHLAVAVTQANTAACALYASLGMEVVGQYHYRIAPEDLT